MLHRRIYPLEKQVLLDREEVQQHLMERGKWLMTALQGYRRCLEAGNSGSSNGNDQRVIFRIIAIWFNICGGVPPPFIRTSHHHSLQGRRPP